MNSTAEIDEPARVPDETDALFHEWEEQEAHVGLADLHWVDAVPFLFFWALFVVVFLQFFTRYVLNDSLGWTEEIARYLLIAVTFTGSAFAMRRGTHIAVEAGLNLMSPRWRARVLGWIEFTVAAFCGAMTYYAFELGNRAPGFMVSIDIPKAYLYWLVAAALAGMTAYAAQRLVARLRGRPPADAHALLLD